MLATAPWTLFLPLAFALSVGSLAGTAPPTRRGRLIASGDPILQRRQVGEAQDSCDGCGYLTGECGYGIVEVVTNWEYARLEYRAAGSFGRDKFMDWNVTFHHPGGAQRWGTDERFDDLRHLNRAGAAGWQAYDRAPMYVINEPHRLFGVSYSLRRALS